MHNPFPNDIQPNTKYGQFPSLPLPFHPKTGKVLCRGNRSIPSNIKMLLCPRPHLDLQFQTITHNNCLSPSPISLSASTAASQTTCSIWAIKSESVPSRTSPTAQSAVSHPPASTDLSLLLWGSSHQPTMRPPDGPAFSSKLPSLTSRGPATTGKKAACEQEIHLWSEHQ